MVNLDEEVSVDDLEFAKQQMLHVNKRLADIKEDLYVGDDYDNPHNLSPKDIEDSLVISTSISIHDCQMCVELSAKSIMKSFGVNPVPRHDLTFQNDRVTGMLQRLPENEDFAQDIPRVIFLTQLWERFYQLSKYGVPEENISTHDFLDESDTIRAVQDADYCRKVAGNSISYVLDRKGLEESDLDLSLMI